MVDPIFGSWIAFSTEKFQGLTALSLSANGAMVEYWAALRAWVCFQGNSVLTRRCSARSPGTTDFSALGSSD